MKELAWETHVALKGVRIAKPALSGCNDVLVGPDGYLYVPEPTLKALSILELDSLVARCLLPRRYAAFRSFAHAILLAGLLANVYIAGKRGFVMLAAIYLIWSALRVLVRVWNESALDVRVAQFLDNPNAIARAIAKVADLNGLPLRWRLPLTIALGGRSPAVRAQAVVGLLPVAPETDAATYLDLPPELVITRPV